MTKRWLGLSIVVLIVSATGVASAQVTTSPTSPISTASTLVNATSTPTTVTITGPSNNYNADLVITTCSVTTGTGTFAFSAQTVKLTTNVDVTYTPTSRGARRCTVSVRTANATFGAGAEIGTFDISGTGVAPVINLVSPALPFSFFGVRVLDTADPNPSLKTQVFTFSNAGDSGQTLTINSINFDNSDYTYAAAPFPINLTQGQSTPVTVTFNPSAAGTDNTTMTVSTNDPLNPMKTITVAGSGTLATIALSDVTLPDAILIDPASPVTTTGNSTASNGAATNTGPLALKSATLTPTTSGNTWFTFGTGLGCTAGQTSCTFTAGTVAPTSKSIPVRCSPPATASGTETATLAVVSDTDAGGDASATISCTAKRPNLLADVSSLDFSSVNVNSPATSKAVVITNNGTADLTFYFTRVGTDAGMFSASTMSGCGTTSSSKCTVTAGGNMTINVGFTPTSAGAKTATLAINNNDPDFGDNPTNIALAGNGVAPVITPTPTSINFMNVEVGKTSAGTNTVSVKNDGTANLTISSASLTGTNPGEFAIASGMAGMQVVAPGATVMWNLTCSPTSQGSKSATFRIVNNSGFPAAMGTINTDISLSCNGQRGVLAINPTSWNFMAVREGDTVTHSFTLTNTGNVDVTNITPMYDATKLKGISVTTYPTMLTAGGGTTNNVVVTFSPADANGGCTVVNAGDCTITFQGDWGVTPTKTSASIVVQGDGINATYDTYPSNPNALDLGSVRWDRTITMPVEVINTGGSPLGIKGASISIGTAMTGELTIANCTHNSVVVPCPTMAAPFNTWTGMGDKLIVNVKCDPLDRVGLITGTLTIASDLNTATPDRVVPLKCTSTTATLALTPSNMVLDFGPTDLDAVPVAVTKRITLQNTGDGPLDIDAGVKSGGGLARYTFTATTAQVVPPGGQFDVDVTYLPIVEKPPNTPDDAALMFPIHGHLMGLNSVTIQISGYGADRHVGVAPAPTFPDTFKNPGDAAPVMPVTIKNTGFAPLDVTGVMLDNDPIWTLVNPDPVVIPADSSHDFMVRFAPFEAGKAPTGHFVIMDNDNEAGKAMVQVDLDGNGLNRDVGFGPTVIQLGFTGIGIPVRLSDIAPNDPLLVQNADTANGFRIANIKVDSISGADGTFEIVDASGNAPTDLMLDPGGQRAFDITFIPNEVGEFEATAALYLDQDPTPQAHVTLRGTGLYVDARGGGGCSTGGGKSTGWLALVLGALVFGRRRRRRGARPALLALGVVGAVTATATDASAQASRDINLNVFEPTPATVTTTFHAQSADIAADGEWAASALLTYANNALILDTSQNDDIAVKNRSMLLVGGAYAFGGHFEGSVRLPVLLQSGDAAGDHTMQFGVDPANGTALADATLQVKDAIGARDFAGGTLSYGATLAFTLPTGTGEGFSGNDLPTVHVLGLTTMTRGRLTTTANLGGVLRERVTFANITQGPGVAWAVGASFRVLDQLWAGGELFGDLVPGGKRTMTGSEVMLNTIEGLAGVHYRLQRTMDLGAGVGRGVTSGPGTPAFRGLVTFQYTPGAEDLRPIHPYRAPKPPKDSDQDGVIDRLDDCVDVAEDKDGFQDDDGCPDNDNDSDGVADSADKCPVAAEDKDRFQDDDGCPDTDNDQDGIADAKDRCPMVSEDKDGFEDGDGCPDPDNDKDGIVDASDKCPTQAEVINGKDDDDGCPDKGDAALIISPDRIELLESIQFSGSRISRSSHNVLGQIGASLRAHPEILRVRLTVHVQPTSNAAADQKLSEARAKAVRDWLVDWGIDQLRLQSSGFGGQKPLVPPKSPGARQINDRVELIVLERK